MRRRPLLKKISQKILLQIRRQIRLIKMGITVLRRHRHRQRIAMRRLQGPRDYAQRAVMVANNNNHFSQLAKNRNFSNSSMPPSRAAVNKPDKTVAMINKLCSSITKALSAKISKNNYHNNLFLFSHNLQLLQTQQIKT